VLIECSFSEVSVLNRERSPSAPHVVTIFLVELPLTDHTRFVLPAEWVVKSCMVV